MAHTSNTTMILTLRYTQRRCGMACMTETWPSLPATPCDDLANARGGRGHSLCVFNEPSWCWARPSTTSISASLPAPAARRWPVGRHRESRSFSRLSRGLLIEIVVGASAGELEEHVHHVAEHRIAGHDGRSGGGISGCACSCCRGGRGHRGRRAHGRGSRDSGDWSELGGAETRWTRPERTVDGSPHDSHACGPAPTLRG